MTFLGRVFLFFVMAAAASAAGVAADSPGSAAPTSSGAASPVVSPADATEWHRAAEWFREIRRFKVGDSSFHQVAACFVVLLLTLILRRALMTIFFRWLERLASKTRWKFDDKLLPALEGPASAMVVVVGVFLAISVLTLDPKIELVVFRVFQASTLVVVFWGFLRISDLVADTFQEVAREKQMSIYNFVPLIKKTTRVFLIIIGVLVVIQNLGYSVSSLLAGLGIGGLAVALAAQESLGNFFGSISIAADRPFKIGDWIQVGDKIDGNVEEVGLRSTRVRTWSKSQLSIPNKVLANEIIENWSRMPKRRVKQVVGVTYETSPEDMAGLVEDIRRLLRDDPGVHQEFILVNFTDFGASSLDVLVYYFTISTQWLEHMDVRQRINIKIMDAVRARGLSIAFPTRTLYFEGDIARRLARGGDDLPQ